MGKKTSVSLGNALDIANASAIKSRLENALSKGSPFVLVSDKVEKADTAGLQLIYAFILAVEAEQGNVSWQNPSDALLQASDTLGMSEKIYLR